MRTDSPLARAARAVLAKLPLRLVFEVFYSLSSDPWDYWRSAFENERYEHALALLRDHATGAPRILEVGCSVGAFTRRLTELEPASLDAVDISAVALRRARRSVPAATFHCLDAFRGPLPDGPFDVITATDVMGYTDDLALLAATRDRLVERLSPNGLVLLGNTKLKAHDGEGWDPFASGYPKLGATQILDTFAQRLTPAATHEDPRYRIDVLVVDG